MGKHIDRTTMKLTTLIITAFFLFSMTACDEFVKDALTDKTYKDTIKQNIGGELIRDIHYYDDFHGWDHDIQYSYKDEVDSIHVIGSGNYHSQDIPKDEQLLVINKWTVLTTNDGFHCKIIVGDMEANNWTEFEISPQTIEDDLVWQNQKINSEPNNGDSKVTFKSVTKGGEFSFIYKFAKKNRIFSFMTGERQVVYKLNMQSGRPEMTNVIEL